MNQREVSEEEGKAFARSKNYIFQETSALDGSFNEFINALQKSLRSYSKMYKLSKTDFIEIFFVGFYV